MQQQMSPQVQQYGTPSQIPQQMTQIPQQMTHVSQQMTQVSQQMAQVPQQMTQVPQQMTQVPQQMTQVPQQMNQMGQQMMLCPIQYVYETPMLVPRPQEEPIQQNHQVLFNIQNTPPWIQNRPQNQLIYVHQVPNNYQSYLQQNMIQAPMYHQQLNYQMQPMLTQDNRQFVQIPNLASYNTAQNQVAQTVPQQQISNEENDKMSLLSQMLSQKNNVARTPSNNNVIVSINNAAESNTNNNNITEPNADNVAGPNIINVTAPNINHVRAPNVNNVRLHNVNNVRVHNVNNVRLQNVNNVRLQNVNHVRTTNIKHLRQPAVNIIRPMMQNQQVQTDISANNRPRPRSRQPQLITINPMQNAQYVTENQQQNVLINITRPAVPYNMGDVPQHIRSKIPSSISVKTIYRPILPRQFRPLEVMPGPQNFFYSPNFVTEPNNPEMRNSINTDNVQEPNKNIQEENNSKPAEVIAPVLKKNPTKKNQEDNVRKRSTDATAPVKTKFDLVKTYSEPNDKTTTEVNTDTNAEFENQPGDKLIRNTVYSQARGRVTEQEVLQNRSLKRTFGDRLDEEKETNNTKNDEDPNSSNNKYAKVELTESASQTNKAAFKATAANIPAKTQFRISDLISNTENERSDVSDTPESEKSKVEPLNSNSPKTEIEKQVVSTDIERRDSHSNEDVSSDKSQENIEPTVVINRMPNFVNNNSVLKVGTPVATKQKDEITVLTHVLDGYIIQESSVAFPIYIPKTENHNKTDKKTDGGNEVKATDETTRMNWRYKDRNIDRETETIEEQNKDDPFANVPKSTVRSWTATQLAEHLAKYDWKETASKLQEEEIDGESLLLVNKDQLLVIGVSEAHADVIAAFTS